MKDIYDNLVVVHDLQWQYNDDNIGKNNDNFFTLMMKVRVITIII